MSTFVESNFKGGKNYAAAQNVASRVAGEETNLRGIPPACFSQLNLEIEKVYISRTGKRIYDCSASCSYILDADQLRVFGTEDRIQGTRVENANSRCGAIAVMEGHLGGGLDTLHAGNGPISNGYGIIDCRHATLSLSWIRRL